MNNDNAHTAEYIISGQYSKTEICFQHSSNFPQSRVVDVDKNVMKFDIKKDGRTHSKENYYLFLLKDNNNIQNLADEKERERASW